MTDMQLTPTREHRSDRSVELRVAPLVDNIAVARTLVGAVGTLEDFDVDSVADLRLAVDEVCTQLIRAASADTALVMVVEPGDDAIRVEVRVACRADPDIVAPGSFSWYVLNSLVDEVRTFRDGQQPGVDGEVCGVVLTRRRVESG